jgi:hypothetical protein
MVLVVNFVSAQTTNNLVSPTGWTGQTYTGAHGGANPVSFLGCCTGSGAYVDTSNGGAITFSYSQYTVQQTIAINNALQNSGVQVSGYNYSWQYLNEGYNGGTLTGAVKLTNSSGSQLGLWNYNMPSTNGNGWATMSGTQNFGPYTSNNLGNLTVSFSGRDNRFWAGFYGPRVQNVNLSLNYSADQCASNPLSSTSCSGYQQAYHDQQCTANPLYTNDCPGYAAAYQTQQCSANPLYATSCPGYAAAYQSQQCSLNPLYSQQCTGYSTAYYNQQCSINPLYDSGCPGYSTAYHAQQCSLNPLYMSDCSGYAVAYKSQQCSLNPLYATDCPGYQQAYVTKQTLKQNSTTVTTTDTPVTTTISVTPVQSPVQSATTTPSTTSPTSVTSVTSVISVPSTTSPTGVTSLSSVATTQTSSTTTSTPAPKQSVKEPDQKSAEAKAKAASESMKNATRMEDQVAAQGAVVNAMAFVPGFAAYQNSIVPDINQLRMARQYSSPPIDNNRTQRLLGGAQERRWNEMVDSQYNNYNRGN